MNNRKHHPKREELLVALERQKEGADLNADYQNDEFTRKALSGLRRHGDVEKAIERLDKRVQHQGRKLRNRPSLIWVPLAMAAACALGLWVWPAAAPGILEERVLVSDTAVGEDAIGLAAGLGEPLPSLSLSRTRSVASVAAEAVLAQAVARYEQGDFEGAVPLFADYAAMAPEAKSAWLFWGHALLQTAPREAIPVLTSLAAEAETDPAVKEQAIYLLAWAYMKSGDVLKARGYFEELAAGGGDLSVKAGAMLHALSK